MWLQDTLRSNIQKLSSREKNSSKVKSFWLDTKEKISIRGEGGGTRFFDTPYVSNYLYLFCADLFATAHIIELFTHTRVKNIKQSLIWAERSLSQGEIPLLCYSLRAFLESAAYFISVCSEIEEHLDRYPFETSDKIEVIDYRTPKYTRIPNWPESHKEWLSLIMRLKGILYVRSIATTIDWYFPEKDFSQMNSENPTISLSKDHVIKPKNIISALRAAESKIDGIKPTYELLSEFLHPNSYPFFAHSMLGIAEDPKLLGLKRQFLMDSPQEDLLESLMELLSPFPNVTTDTLTVVLQYVQRMMDSKTRLIEDIKKIIVKPNAAILSSYTEDFFLKETCFCGGTRSLKRCCGKYG